MRLLLLIRPIGSASPLREKDRTRGVFCRAGGSSQLLRGRRGRRLLGGGPVYGPLAATEPARDLQCRQPLRAQGRDLVDRDPEILSDLHVVLAFGSEALALLPAGRLHSLLQGKDASLCSSCCARSTHAIWPRSEPDRLKPQASINLRVSQLLYRKTQPIAARFFRGTLPRPRAILTHSIVDRQTTSCHRKADI